MLLTILQEIVTIWTERKVLPKEFWQEEVKRRKAHTTKKLYDYLRYSDTPTEGGATKLIYGNASGSHALRRLRDRLWHTLKRSVFMLDLKMQKNSPHFQAVYEVHRELFLARMLSMLGAHHAPVYIIQKALLKAQRFHITEATIGLYTILRNEAKWQGKQREYLRYSALLQTTMEVLLVEQECETLCSAFSLDVATTVQSPKHQEATEQGLRRVHMLNQKINTCQTNQCYFNFAICFYERGGDYIRARQTAEQALQYLEQNPQFYRPTLAATYYQSIMFCSIHLRDFARGYQCKEQALDSLPPKSNVRLCFLRYYMQLCLHDANIKQAAQSYANIQDTARLASQPMHRRTEIELLHGYWWWYSCSHNTDSELCELSAQFPFDATEFFSNIRELYRDKEGCLFSAKILRLLLMLQDKDYTAAGREIESLQRYASRYAGNALSQRSRLFVQALHLLADSGFDPTMIPKQTQSLLEHLRNVSSITKHKKGSPSTILNDPAELIPYPVIWERLLQMI